MWIKQPSKEVYAPPVCLCASGAFKSSAKHPADKSRPNQSSFEA